MREHHDELRGSGADVVTIGTGDRRYAAEFVRETGVAFLVLVDDDARAARAAGVGTAGFLRLLHPATWRPTVATWRRGHRIHRTGRRVSQLGATFVLGAGNIVRYEHRDRDSTDHAPIPDVLAALDARS